MPVVFRAKFLLLMWGILFLSPRLTVFAQSDIRDPDALRQELAAAQQDTQKVLLLAQLANSLFQSDPNQALEYAQEGEALAMKIGFQKGLGDIYLSLGNIHYIRGDHPRQLDYYLKSLKIRDDLGDREGVGHCYNNLGNFYLNQGDLDKAQDNFEKSLSIRKEIGQKNSIAGSLNNLGNVSLQKMDYEKAIEYYNQAILLNEETGNKHSAAIALGNMGLIYSRQENLDKALEYYRRSLELRQELNQKNGIALLNNRIGQIYYDKGDLNRSIEYFETGLKIGTEIGGKPYLEVSYEGLANAYEAKGNLNKSVYYLRKFISIKDSLYNTESANAIAEMEAKYKAEVQKKEQEKTLQEKELRELEQNERYARIKILTIAAIIAFLLILILAFVLYNQARNKTKANFELEKQVQNRTRELTESNARLENEVQERIKTSQDLIRTNEELNTFIYKSSHDIKSPLTSIRGLVDIAASETDPNSPHKQYFELISERIDHLNTILERLIQNVRMKEGKIEQQQVDLKELVAEALEKSQKIDGFKEIEFKSEFDFEGEFETDKSFMLIILQNLISNAIIFRKQEKGAQNWCRIQFRKEVGPKLVIQVMDNGIGIPERIHNRVFDMFYRGSLASKGTGLGLYIVRNLVRKLGGDVSFQSEENMGSTFTVMIPEGGGAGPNLPANNA